MDRMVHPSHSKVRGMILDMEPVPFLRGGFSLFPEVIDMDAFPWGSVDTPSLHKNSKPAGSSQILRCFNFSLGVSYFPIDF